MPDDDKGGASRVRRWSIWLKVAITLALLAWLLGRIDLASVAKAVMGLSADTIAVAVGLVLLQHVVLAWRWHRIVRWLGGDWSLRNSLKWLFIGLFLNQALPTGIGGDAARMWALHRNGHSAAVAVSSVVAERGTGLAVLCLMIVLAVLVGPSSLATSRLGQVLVLCSLGVIALLATLVLADRWLTRWLPARIAGPSGRLAAAVRSVCATRRAFLEVLAGGVVAASLGLWAGIVLGDALGVGQEASVYVALIGATVLLTLVPVSLGGWGVREAGMVALFSQMGSAPEPVLALSVLWGLLPLSVALPGALLLWISGTGAARGEKIV